MVLFSIAFGILEIFGLELNCNTKVFLLVSESLYYLYMVVQFIVLLLHCINTAFILKYLTLYIIPSCILYCIHSWNLYIFIPSCILYLLAILYCTVLYCTVLYCTVLYCTVLYCTVLYCAFHWHVQTGQNQAWVRTIKLLNGTQNVWASDRSDGNIWMKLEGGPFSLDFWETWISYFLNKETEILRFYVRFSFDDGCERVDEMTVQVWVDILRTFVTHLQCWKMSCSTAARKF
jgi:hypothetical protein